MAFANNSPAHNSTSRRVSSDSGTFQKLALTPEKAETPIAGVPYSCRATAVSGWLVAGVDPVEVARRAGHSVAVLLRFYAKIVAGREDHANALIERFLGGADLEK